MIKIISFLLFALLVFVETGFCQSKKIKIKDPNTKNSWEEIYVLKSNKNIRNGQYQRIDNKKVSVEGSYTKGQKTGVWKVYDYFDKPEIEIDYDKGIITYCKTDSVTKKDIMLKTGLSNSDRPLLNISGSNMVFGYIFNILSYPVFARENSISGKVYIAVRVDPIGKIIGYRVKTSVHKSLDDESLRVVKMMPLEFLPEIKNGVPVESEMIIPVNFVLS